MVKKKKVKKRIDKNFSLKKNFSLSWNYLKESRKFIYTAIILFFVFAFIGFIFPTPDSILQIIFDTIKEILAKTEGLSPVGLFAFIFMNNLEVSLIGMIAGIIFGIFPLMTAVANGYFLGFVGKYSVSQEGILSLWKILPHGIFELPAIFISLGLGLRLGIFLFNKKEKSFRENVIDSLRAFFFIVVPLLFIAAIIETSLIFLLG